MILFLVLGVFSGLCWSRLSGAFPKHHALLYAGEHSPTSRSVPLTPAAHNARVVESFVSEMTATLAKRQETLRCGIFDVTFINPEPSDNFKTASCYAMREVVSSRFDVDALGPSYQPVRVQAEFGNLAPGILGGAGAAAYCNDSADGTYKPLSYYRLQDTMVESCGDDPEFDILMIFSTSSDIAWYLGMDANPPSNTYDFVTVVAHEIGHGLGFASGIGFDVDSYGYVTYATYEFSDGIAFFDTLLHPALSAPLINYVESPKNMSFYPFQATGNVYPPQPIYSPPDAEPGSSGSHWTQDLDVTDAPPTCSSLGFDVCNSLMRPQLPNGLAIHRLGGNFVSYLDNVGYDMFDCTTLTTEEECLGDPNEEGARCDWCATGQFCTLITMIDYIWNNQSCEGNSFTLPANGAGLKPVSSSSSALSSFMSF